MRNNIRRIDFALFHHIIQLRHIVNDRCLACFDCYVACKKLVDWISRRWRTVYTCQLDGPEFFHHICRHNNRGNRTDLAADRFDAVFTGSYLELVKNFFSEEMK